jgi:predicted ATPase/class 3 adenylate cyclase
MTGLPTGTITFLFTDIEGSTRLIRKLGREAYRRVQDDHGHILRDAIAAGQGVEVRTEGDSFFAVFRTPDGALQAAISAQRQLQTHDWPDEGTVRVRMGMHTGEGVLGGMDADYLGLDVNRAARIAAAGHGGQVLLSQATLSLVEHTLPAGVSLRDLGLHRLKDLEHPEHLHDLAIDGLRADFPDLKSLDVRPTNLPAQRTSFVGRELELVKVTDLLGRTRLLTLTGTGGTGKTRLALKVAADQLERFPDGVFLVDLSAVTNHMFILTEIAAALRVREEPGRDLATTLGEHLENRELLLVIDNMEQVVEAAPAIGRLLDAASRIRVLVTSRVPLRISGEQVYEVLPLPLPFPQHIDHLERLVECESVALFLERAAAVRPGFQITQQTAAAVAEITARLDGLPLALELAASRVKILSPIELAALLEERLPLLTGGARDLPKRQRTLRAAIQWSYDLLSPDERRLFARAAAFSGGWTLESAAFVCGPGARLGFLEGLESLVENGLVQRLETADGAIRFRMLETVAEFAGGCLASSDEEDIVRRRHAEYFRDIAEQAEPHLTDEHRTRWLQYFEHEHDNVRAALEWAEKKDDAGTALRLATALWRFWQQRGHLQEGRGRLERLTALPAAKERDAVRARALSALGGVAFWQNDYEAVRRPYEEAVEIARELEDPTLLSNALYDLSFVSNIADGNFDRAEETLRESLAHSERDLVLTARIWTALGYTEALRGNLASAIEKLQQGTHLHREHGNRLFLAENLIALAGLTFSTDMDKYEEARGYLDEAVNVMAQTESPIVFATVLPPLAFLANHEGRHRRAARLMGLWEAMREELGGGPPSAARAHFADPEADARAALGDDEYDRIRAEGHEMTVEEVVAYALSNDD